MTDEQLFNDLYKRYKGFAHNNLFLYRFETQDREDLKQEYFEMVYDFIKKKSITENDSFEAYKMKLWLTTTIQKFLLKRNAVKRQAQNTAISLSSTYEGSDYTITDRIRDLNCPDTDSILLKKERSTMLINALKSLTIKERDYIQRYYFNGQTLEEIAEYYGVTKQGIWIRLQTILNKLRNNIEEYLDGESL